MSRSAGAVLRPQPEADVGAGCARQVPTPFTRQRGGAARGAPPGRPPFLPGRPQCQFVINHRRAPIYCIINVFVVCAAQVRKGDRGLVVVGASLQKGDTESGEGLESQDGGGGGGGGANGAGAFGDDDVLREAMRLEREARQRSRCGALGLWGDGEGGAAALQVWSFKGVGMEREARQRSMCGALGGVGGWRGRRGSAQGVELWGCGGMETEARQRSRCGD
eukprot:365506-Chlamydomonas_euryale.AAC.17